MKVNSIQQQNFRGVGETIVNKLADNPKLISGIAGLAGCSVVAQKLVMSSGEATVGPLVDIGVGKAITKVTGEKDGRTNQSSKVQAARTVSQTIGGTITGIAIRMACIGAMTALCIAAGRKAGGAVAKILTENGKVSAESALECSEKVTESGILDKFQKKNLDYQYSEKMEKWGKNLGGAVATCVMMVTNFLLDVPLINHINKKYVTPLFGIKPANDAKAKEVK